MGASSVEVADVLRSYASGYLDRHPASLAQRKVINDLIGCRSARLGGHLRQCPKCGHQLIAYNSCRNRHCPKCQRQKQADWLTSQAAYLLDVPYFHIVFTLPQSVGPLALQNKRLLYGLLFRSAASAMLRMACDPRHLGAKIGFTAILHTWGQTLMHHPHLHCLVPAGGLSQCGQTWVPARQGFFLPVRPLARLFRGCYMDGLRQAYNDGQLELAGNLVSLSNPARWNTLLQELQQVDWVVYAKPAFGSPRIVLKYLARYTHRVAISNHRLLSADNGRVAFRYKDYQHHNRQRVMHLSAVEFIRRFLLHILPKGFVRIRHYGLLANRSRDVAIALCRTLLDSRARVRSVPTPVPIDPSPDLPDNQNHFPCPVCDHTTTMVIALLPPVRDGPAWYHSLYQLPV